MLVLGVVVACSGGREAAPEPTPLAPASPFSEIVVDTAPGLSGLAADPDDGIWAIAERAERAYRITLDGERPALETFEIHGVPEHTDLEGIAYLTPDRFALGTEGQHDGIATVLLAERRDHTLSVTGSITIDASSLGVTLKANNGAEGLCGAGDTIVVAIETAGVENGKRWAPVAIVSRGKIARVHRVWLTTATGKLSGLDCTVAPDGTVTAIAIERHFEVTRVLSFTLPPIAQGSDDITPTIALDLGPILRGRLNLEGVARLRDGRVVAVVDNQWKTITGPSELLVFPRGSIAPLR